MNVEMIISTRRRHDKSTRIGKIIRRNDKEEYVTAGNSGLMPSHT
jgi:hypothetical protein